MVTDQYTIGPRFVAGNDAAHRGEIRNPKIRNSERISSGVHGGGMIRC